jgi:tRNA G18 (ribose-2'-O)-methylase SpoU
MSEKYRKLKLAELNRTSTEAYKNETKIPLIVVLDNIRSLHNIGSVFRTADAFRIKEIWLCGFTAQPPHREIHKTALGATESVAWSYYETAIEAIKTMRQRTIKIVPVEQAENSTSLADFKVNSDTDIAVIFGNEVEGVSKEFMEVADEVIEIPQEGTKHSLNISVSAGIVLWHLFNKF